MSILWQGKHNCGLWWRLNPSFVSWFLSFCGITPSPLSLLPHHHRCCLTTTTNTKSSTQSPSPIKSALTLWLLPPSNPTTKLNSRYLSITITISTINHHTTKPARSSLYWLPSVLNISCVYISYVYRYRSISYVCISRIYNLFYVWRTLT